MTAEIDELRPLKAGQVLAIWQALREETEDALERTLRCNARVLAESCFFAGEQVFPDERAVLDALTGREMERLLRTLAGETTKAPEAVNPAFDPARFYALEG